MTALIEIMVAACMYLNSTGNQMECHKQHSEWLYERIITRFYPDPGNNYSTPTCWLVEWRGHRTLMAESCEDFSKRLKSVRRTKNEKI